jgi:hypothetical protein
MSETPEIRTERLWLRPWRESDLEGHSALMPMLGWWNISRGRSSGRIAMLWLAPDRCEVISI